MARLARCGAFVILLLALVKCAYAGPFGLERGMTKAQIIQLVGRSAVIADKTDALEGSDLTLSTVPKPYKEFERYILVISKSDGLLKVLAVGRDFDTSADGEQLRDHYSALLNLLSSSYSSPTESFDFLKDGSIWTDAQDFTMGLLKQDRTLESYWVASKGPALKDSISAINLSANASSRTAGYINLGYEFAGWDAYVDRLKAQEGSVL